MEQLYAQVLRPTQPTTSLLDSSPWSPMHHHDGTGLALGPAPRLPRLAQSGGNQPAESSHPPAAPHVEGSSQHSSPSGTNGFTPVVIVANSRPSVSALPQAPTALSGHLSAAAGASAATPVGPSAALGRARPAAPAQANSFSGSSSATATANGAVSVLQANAATAPSSHAGGAVGRLPPRPSGPPPPRSRPRLPGRERGDLLADLFGFLPAPPPAGRSLPSTNKIPRSAAGGGRLLPPAWPTKSNLEFRLGLT